MTYLTPDQADELILKMFTDDVIYGGTPNHFQIDGRRIASDSITPDNGTKFTKDELDSFINVMSDATWRLFEQAELPLTARKTEEKIEGCEILIANISGMFNDFYLSDEFEGNFIPDFSFHILWLQPIDLIPFYQHISAISGRPLETIRIFQQFREAISPEVKAHLRSENPELCEFINSVTSSTNSQEHLSTYDPEP